LEASSLDIGGILKKLSIAVVMALALGLGAAPAKAIVFGEEIIDSSTTYPWVASIWHAGPDDEYYIPICTGSLIAPDVVLTAAHCIFKRGTYYVQMGSDTLDGDNDFTFYEIDAVWKNPRYSKKTLINDVGLLKLTTPQTNVTPMKYARKGDLKALKKVKTFEILGWGIDQDGEDASFLKYTKVSNQAKAARSLYPSKYYNPNTMIAAGRYIKRERVYTGACNGDSGGPLIAKVKGVEKVVGITSWGKKGCNTKAPTVFSNVAYYAKDISKGIATLRRSALVLNRAMPSNVSEPSISIESGSLTCNPGQWSDNTATVDIQWSAPYSVMGSTTSTVKLPSTTYSDTKYTCLVTATNDNGAVSLEASITIPAIPYSSTGPSIDGVGSSFTPNLNSTMTCSPPTWQGSDVATAFSWYASPFSTFYSARATLLGEGSSLVMSESVEAALVGRNYLHCVVVGSNSGGAATFVDSVYVYRPFTR
jgi:secreted trypsin-like serine protease